MEYDTWHKAESIIEALGIDTNHFDVSLYPGHICGQCSETVKKFLKLKHHATINQHLILEHQEDIRLNGITQFSNKTDFHNLELIQNKSKSERRTSILKWVRIHQINKGEKRKINFENNNLV